MPLNNGEIKGPIGYLVITVAYFVFLIFVLLLMAFVIAIAIGLVFGVAFFLLFFAIILIMVAAAAVLLLGWPIYLLSGCTPFFVYIPVFIAWLLVLVFLLRKTVKFVSGYKLEEG